MLLTNSAEGGTNGTTVSTGNSGGASGTAFDAVTVGASTTVAYDSGNPGHGSLAIKMDAASGSAGGYVAWQSGSVGTRPVVWFRLCVKVTSTPAADTPLVSFYGGGTLRARLWLTSTRTLKWTNAAGATIQTSASTLTASTYGRIEGYVIGDASTGKVETNLYATIDTLTAAQTQTSAATQNTGGTIDQVRFGNETGVVSTYYLDDVALSDTGYLGAAGVSVSNLAPATAAMAALGGFTRTICSGVPKVTPPPTSGQLWPRATTIRG